MAIAPERMGIGLRRHFTTEGVHPYDTVTWERRDARITNFRDGSVAFEQLGVEVPSTWSLNATNILAQKYFRGPWAPRARVVAAAGRRPGGRHHHRVGRQGRLLPRRRRGRRLQRRAEVPHPPPEGGVQLAGVVQHRRRRRAEHRLGVLHPRRRRHHDGRSSTGTSRRARSSRAARGRASTCPASARRSSCSRAAAPRRVPVSFMRGADASAGTIKSGGKTGRPRWSSSTPTIPTSRTSSGARRSRSARRAPGRRRLRHGPRRQGQPLDPVPERQQLGAGHRRVHAGRARRRRLGAQGGHHRRGHPHREGPRPVPPDRPGGVGVRRPRHAVRHHHQPVAHRRPTPAASTAPTRARNTCTSTTRRATWRRSTC